MKNEKCSRTSITRGERIIHFMIGVGLIVWLLFLVSVSGCTRYKRIEIDVNPPNSPDFAPYDDYTVYSFCKPPRGENQEPEERMKGQAYDSLPSGCI